MIRLIAIFFISYTADLSLGIVVGAFFIDILLNHSSLSFYCSFLLLLSRFIGGLFLVCTFNSLFISLLILLHLQNGVLFHYSINSYLHMSYLLNLIHSLFLLLYLLFLLIYTLLLIIYVLQRSIHSILILI